VIGEKFLREVKQLISGVRSGDQWLVKAMKLLYKWKTLNYLITNGTGCVS
jgi:hypothetical protein